MTSTNVTQTASLLLGAANVSAAGSLNKAVDAGFSQVMSRTSQDCGGQMQQPGKGVQSGSVKTPVKVERNNIKKTPDKAEEEISAQEEKLTDTDVEETAQEDEAAREILAGAVMEVKNAIQEELGISAEELETVMDELGLTEADLLQPDMMQAIVVAAAGETDDLCLLTNENLYQNIQNLKGTVEDVLSDVKSQLGLDDVEVTELLQQMETGAMQENPGVSDGNIFDENEGVIAAQQETAVQTELNAAETKDVRSENNSSDANEQSLEASLKEADRTEEAVTSQVKTGKKSSETGKESEEGNQNHFLQGWSRTGTDVWDTGSLHDAAQARFEAVDADNIMNQVTEYMKVEVKSEITQLQLQLQPETLGTLHIHLTAKEGAVTAQFIAENEAVKSVLEAQAAQLKENLNDQGVKVEAVEVTVASHEFNRSFAENGESGSRYEEPKKKGARKIQLNGDIPLEEMDLSEEDRIAAEMMERSGNTVDYTA